MEKFEVVKKYQDFEDRLQKIEKVINIVDTSKKIAEYDAAMGQNDFWTDQKAAKKIIAEANSLKEKVNKYQELRTSFEVIGLILELDDEQTYATCDEQVNSMEKELADFETKLLLNEEFDYNNAIMEIHPGAGGTESQDWSLMLFRMYKRYAEKNNFTFEVIDYEEGDEAGLKSATFQISGPYAYGMLKGETGAHRLIRLSPFNANNLRQTSFAGVSVVPEINDEIEIEIRDEDIRIDTYHSSGAGGQHINKTDSAVRITHFPTGIVVCSQAQRSQIQNREKAMQVLKTRLYQRELDIKNAKKKEMSGELGNNGFGSQIRSYVLHPYTMVNDARTKVETANAAAVLDGDIEMFLDSYLHYIKQNHE